MERAGRYVPVNVTCLKKALVLSWLLGLPPGVAVNSGTAALHLALLGIGPGDEVILPSYVCVGPLHAIQYVGAKPRLADLDPATYNLDPADVRRPLTRRTRAIIVPHQFGLPADLDSLLAFGISLIEDGAKAIGARWAYILTVLGLIIGQAVGDHEKGPPTVTIRQGAFIPRTLCS